jgi:hypothetical protein
VRVEPGGPNRARTTQSGLRRPTIRPRRARKGATCFFADQGVRLPSRMRMKLA